MEGEFTPGISPETAAKIKAYQAKAKAAEEAKKQEFANLF